MTLVPLAMWRHWDWAGVLFSIAWCTEYWGKNKHGPSRSCTKCVVLCRLFLHFSISIVTVLMLFLTMWAVSLMIGSWFLCQRTYSPLFSLCSYVIMYFYPSHQPLALKFWTAATPQKQRDTPIECFSAALRIADHYVSTAGFSDFG